MSFQTDLRLMYGARPMFWAVLTLAFAVALA
jgi:hypothetical protein